MQSRSALRDLALATFILALSISGCGRKSAPAEFADTIFINGGIYTVDAKRSWAEAAAVRDGRIVAVGRNEEVLPLKGDTTRVVDLAGRMALPGFHDSHVHVASAGLEEMQCPLNDLQDRRGDPRRRHGLRRRRPGRMDRRRRMGPVVVRPQQPAQGAARPGGTGPGRDPGGADGHSGLGELACARARGISAKTPDPENGNDRARRAHRRAERHAARDRDRPRRWTRPRSPARRCGSTGSSAGSST